MSDPAVTEAMEREALAPTLREILQVPWRTVPRLIRGHVSTRICVVVADLQDHEYPTILVLDDVSTEIAEHVVTLHNAWLSD